MYPLIAAPDFDDTPVKIMISIAKGRLAVIDAKARRVGLTRLSDFFMRRPSAKPVAGPIGN